MADWYGKARSNYFRVKDRAAFNEWVASVGDLEVFEDEDGRVGLFADDEFGGWPACSAVAAKGNKWIVPAGGYEEAPVSVVFPILSLAQELAAHLQDGSVAILVEIGAEKLRYITGQAVAVNSKGEMVDLALGAIVALAESLGEEVTPPEY